MTEVRRPRGEKGKESSAACFSSDGGVGLFATRDFAVGDIILHDKKPLIRLTPATEQEEKAIADEFFLLLKTSTNNGEKMAGRPKKDDTNPSSSSPTTTRCCLLDLIETPDDDTLIEDDNQSKFRAMVQAALCFIHQKPTDEQVTALLELYHPKLEAINTAAASETTGAASTTSSNNTSNTEPSASSSSAEQVLVRLSEQAMTYLETILAKKHLDDTTLLHHHHHADRRLVLQKVMLIWACNAFQGGRIYHPLISRINHSCDPNAVVAVGVAGDDERTTDDDDCQIIRAAAPIRSGDEITISYLAGTVLYADRNTRRAALRCDKAFDCACPRCSSSKDVGDKACAIPCPSCHPRMLPGKRQLEEDVQYDDEQMVHYICPTTTETTLEQQQDNNNMKTKTVVCYRCDACNFCFQSSDDGDNDHDERKASNPEFKRLLQTCQSVVDRVVVFLKDHEAWRNRTKESTKDGDDGDDDDDEAAAAVDMVHIDTLEQRLQMASSVLGARHWATNMMMLLQLDQTLQTYHASLLVPTTSDDNKEAAMETIAQAIDMLERICRFVDGLVELKLHKGHLLSDVIIGTARALVSLGDVKSQKYAAEWLEKLDDDDDGRYYYVENFESEGMRKVVQTLKEAWRRTEEEESSSSSSASRPEKRAKR